MNNNVKKKIRAGRYPTKLDFEADIQLIEPFSKNALRIYRNNTHDSKVEAIYKVPDNSVVAEYKPGVKGETTIYVYKKLGSNAAPIEFTSFNDLKRFAKRLRDEKVRHKMQDMKEDMLAGKQRADEVFESLKRNYSGIELKEHVTTAIKWSMTPTWDAPVGAYSLSFTNELKKRLYRSSSKHKK